MLYNLKSNKEQGGENMEEVMFTFKAKLFKRYYPKGNKKVKHGDWQINRMKVVEYPTTDGFQTKYGQVTIIGVQPALEDDDTVYTITATQKYEEKFNEYQYEVVHVQEQRELNSAEEKRAFLQTFLTDKQVNSLYGAFVDPFKVLENGDISELTSKVKGVGEKTAEKIMNKYLSSKELPTSYIELLSMGLTHNMIGLLKQTYTSTDIALGKIKDNPYVLAEEVRGIGFLKAQEIAEMVGIPKTDPRAVRAFILHHFSVIGESGHTYTTLDILEDDVVDKLGLEDIDVLDEQLDILVDKGLVKHFPSEDGDVFALRSNFLIEKEIARHIHRLLDGSNNIQLDKNVAMERIKEQEKRQGYTFTNRQLEGVFAIMNNNVTIIRGYGGCVDCDTEYFDGTKWKRIADYQEGDQVLQYNADGSANLVYPSKYTKVPADTLYHFKTKYGTDQCLSLGHRVVYRSSKGNLVVKPFEDVIQMHNNCKSGFTGKFYTTFNYDGQGINMTEEQIRLQIAVMADGHFSNSSQTNWCTMRLKKERKCQRIEMLLNNANIEYKKHYEESTGFNIYKFYAPRREKEFESYWYNCNKEQFEIVCDEVLHWDGSTRNKKEGSGRFSSTSKETIDFIQFAFATIGKRCSINKDKRAGQPITGKGDKDYRHVKQCYELSITDRNMVGIGGFKPHQEKTKITPYKTLDGYQYCFTVPSSMLVLRRNGRIFITGNTGKSSSVAGVLACVQDVEYSFVQTALSGKASVNLADITGQEGYTIHRLLEYNVANAHPTSVGDGVSFFGKHEQSPLRCDMVILDETSMVDAKLFLDLIQAIPTGAKFVMLGDTNQLESIGIGNVMKDLIDSGVVPCITFDEIHRQGAKSGIIPTSIKISQGEKLYNNNHEGIELVGELKDLKTIAFSCDKGDTKPSIDLIMQEFKAMYRESKDISEIAIVLPTKSSGTSCYKVNKLVQDLVLPRKRGEGIELGTTKEPYTIYKGDKVINLKNFRHLDIFNGNMGEVVDINHKEGTVTVDFYNRGEKVFGEEEIQSLALGYAVTCHKCQGSTVPYLIYCIDYSHYTMLNKEQVYTGITRAKKKCSFIFETKALNKAITTSGVKYKRTFLYPILMGEIA